MGTLQLKDRPSIKRLARKRPLSQGLDISAIVIVERGETRALAANLSTLRMVLDANCKRHDLTIVQNGGETDAARKEGIDEPFADMKGYRRQALEWAIHSDALGGGVGAGERGDPDRPQ